MSRIVSVWLPRWPITRFLAAQALGPSNSQGSPPQVDPDRPFVLAVACKRRPAHRRLERCGGSRRPCDRRILGRCAGESRYAAGARRRCRSRRCRAAPRRLVGDALHADRSRRGMKTMARTVFSSTSKARRICSAARRSSSPILLCGWKISACRRGLRSPQRPARPGRCRAFTARHYLLLPPGRGSRGARRHAGRGVAACSGNPQPPAPARFQNRRRIDRQAARAVRRAICRRTVAPSRSGARPLDEPLTPIVAPPVYHSLHYLLEPIVAQEAVIARASRMMQELVNVLTRDDAGARALRLCLYRVDGAVETVDIGLTVADAQRRSCGASSRPEARNACGDA